jgi:hypothetical protein
MKLVSTPRWIPVDGSRGISGVRSIKFNCYYYLFGPSPTMAETDRVLALEDICSFGAVFIVQHPLYNCDLST